MQYALGIFSIWGSIHWILQSRFFRYWGLTVWPIDALFALGISWTVNPVFLQTPKALMKSQSFTVNILQIPVHSWNEIHKNFLLPWWGFWFPPVGPVGPWVLLHPLYQVYSSCFPFWGLDGKETFIHFPYHPQVIFVLRTFSIALL